MIVRRTTIACMAAALAHGTVTLTAVVIDAVTRPAISYSPAVDWSGPDSFGYSVTDASGTSSVAQVVVTVTPASTPRHAVTLSTSATVVVLHRMTLVGVVVVRAFLAAGWQWGGRWARHDYQHFSANGR